MNHLAKLTFALILLSHAAAANICAAEECLECHGDINLQLKGSSHHIQGAPATAKHCYTCHWEATADGSINNDYHRKEPGRIQLVIWGKGERPTAYVPYSTAIDFFPAAIGTMSERREISHVTRHCLSCHSDRNNTTTPFAGDTFTPIKYAWDGQSVAARYEQKGVTPWGKYSTATTNKKKQLTKALSAHGNAAANEGGWSQTGGYDSPIPVTRGGSSSKNIECYDCHNPHGSSISGVTSSYRSDSGSRSGGLLKQTAAGKNGYSITYTPSANADLQSANPYSPGAGLCFDCHETESSGVTPWGYSTTFGITEPVMGYKDTHKFGSGMKGSTSRHANRQGRSEIISSHLKSSIFLTYSSAEGIHGLCTPCHDPHGVSPTMGEKKMYAIPLLKGTWLTSPYKEDSPPKITPGGGGPAKQGGLIASGATGTTKGPVSMQGMQYNVDRNTFEANSRIDEDVDSFAGLCLKCHYRLSSKGDSKTARIHRAVKGWGENKEHSFPCSKCHQAHNSGLPRLMQTNCFEEGPAGLRNNVGLAWLPGVKTKGEGKSGGTLSSSNSTTASKNRSEANDFVGCHVRQFGRSSSQRSEKNESDWNEKTKW